MFTITLEELKEERNEIIEYITSTFGAGNVKFIMTELLKLCQAEELYDWEKEIFRIGRTNNLVKKAAPDFHVIHRQGLGSKWN